jgi:multidrug resistance efflux pump
MGLLGAAAVGGVAYAAGNSAAKSNAREADQAEQLAYLQNQVAQQQAQLQQQQAAPPPPPPPPAAAPPAPPSGSSMDAKIAQLQELGNLKTAGVLTEEEFAAQKARILAS